MHPNLVSTPEERTDDNKTAVPGGGHLVLKECKTKALYNFLPFFPPQYKKNYKLD